MHRFFIQNTIEQKMYTLLKSMEVNPNIAKASDELSLTIGDITSLFVQQMEPVDREGVHSPEVEVTDDPMVAVPGPSARNVALSEDEVTGMSDDPAGQSSENSTEMDCMQTVEEPSSENTAGPLEEIVDLNQQSSDTEQGSGTIYGESSDSTTVSKNNTGSPDSEVDLDQPSCSYSRQNVSDHEENMGSSVSAQEDSL